MGENTKYIGESIGAGAKKVGNSLTSTTLKTFIEKNCGYPFEKHVYKTSDGCLNSVVRIPGKKGETNTVCPVTGNTKSRKRGPVVIYQHGLLDCCAGIIDDGEDSLGLRLVN